MMTITPLLASEGFGLNFNILQTNLINLAIVIGVLVWFLKGFLGGILERRRSAILQDLQDAEARFNKATEDLALNDLPGRLDDQAQARLLDASIANLKDA